MKLGNRVMPRHTWGTLNEQLDWPLAESRSWGSMLSHAEWHHQESYRPTTAKLTNPGVFLIICQQGHVGGRSPPQMNNPQRKPACMQAKRITLTIFGGQGVMHLLTTLNWASLRPPQHAIPHTADLPSRESKSMTGLHLKPHFY
jgi:hypothetical protein